MGTDDASFADMHRPRTGPDADPLALDEETVERLLAGDLPPSRVPPGYAEVAALLTATTAPPTPEELAGQSKVLVELRVATRPRRAGAHARRAARPPRRRWAGLAAVALVGALVTGGAAAAATGNLPAPVRDIARSIVGAGPAGGAEPATPTQPDRQPATAASSAVPPSAAAGPTRPTPTDSAAPGSGSGTAGSVAVPDKEGLCRAYLASQDQGQGQENKMDAAAFERLAKAAGGESRIPAYCSDTQPGDPKKDERQQPPGGPGQGQGGPPTSSGSPDQGKDDSGTRSTR